MEQPDRKFEEIYNVNDYEISTDTGWKDIYKVCKTIPYKVYEIILENGKKLKCADDHILFSEGKEVFVKNISIGQIIDIDGGISKCISIENFEYEDNMYDLQVDGNKYYSNGLLSHNTTVVGVYALWFSLFHADKIVGIVSNKESSAKMILARIQRMYKSLPAWLKPGVEEFSKMFITFDNGSRMLISATSADAFRGETINLLICLGGENKVKIRDKITKDIKDIPIELLYEELQNGR